MLGGWSVSAGLSVPLHPYARPETNTGLPWVDPAHPGSLRDPPKSPEMSCHGSSQTSTAGGSFCALLSRWELQKIPALLQMGGGVGRDGLRR